MLYKYDLPIYNLKCNFKQIPLLFNQLLENYQDREFIKKDIISIDPDGCRDIDDALSYYVENSILHLQIHISDVYYLLKNLKLLDIENVTSIYLKNCVIPMLPNLISNIGY